MVDVGTVVVLRSHDRIISIIFIRFREIFYGKRNNKKFSGKVFFVTHSYSSVHYLQLNLASHLMAACAFGFSSQLPSLKFADPPKTIHSPQQSRLQRYLLDRIEQKQIQGCHKVRKMSDFNTFC